MARHTISVAVATCRRPDALRTCLAALSAQTRAPDQLIVVDQGPVDATREVVEQCAFPVAYVKQPRRGLSASRNRALEIATGSVLAVTDDDCFPDSGWIEAIMATFETPEVTAVTGPVLPPGGKPPKDMCALSLRPSRETRLFSSRVAPWRVGSGANLAALCDILRELGGWDERLGVGSRGMAGEDVEILDRLLAAGGRIVYNGDALMHHAWQTRDRRRETRWSYGYGVGALSGLRLAQRDAYGWRMLASYSKMHLRQLLRSARRGEWNAVREHVTSLSALVPSLLYGLRVASSPSRRPPEVL